MHIVFKLQFFAILEELGHYQVTAEAIENLLKFRNAINASFSIYKIF